MPSKPYVLCAVRAAISLIVNYRSASRITIASRVRLVRRLPLARIRLRLRVRRLRALMEDML
jgi:hypothetical protein